MSYEIDVLRTLFRLAKKKKSPTLNEIVVRVGTDAATVGRTLFSLVQNGLVQRTPGGPRLSMMGLAIAVAADARARKNQRAKSLPRKYGVRRSTARRTAA